MLLDRFFERFEWQIAGGKWAKQFEASFRKKSTKNMFKLKTHHPDRLSTLCGRPRCRLAYRTLWWSLEPQDLQTLESERWPLISLHWISADTLSCFIIADCLAECVCWVVHRCCWTNKEYTQGRHTEKPRIQREYGENTVCSVKARHTYLAHYWHAIRRATNLVRLHGRASNSAARIALCTRKEESKFCWCAAR